MPGKAITAACLLMDRPEQVSRTPWSVTEPIKYVDANVGNRSYFLLLNFLEDYK